MGHYPRFSRIYIEFFRLQRMPGLIISDKGKKRTWRVRGFVFNRIHDRLDISKGWTPRLYGITPFYVGPISPTPSTRGGAG